MARPDETDDLDELIDRAVDTFFVEAPTEEETATFAPPPKVSPPPKPKVSPSPQPKVAPVPQPKVAPTQPPPPTRSGRSSTFDGPSLDEAVDSLFMSAFQETPTSVSSVTSGDDETDRAIDLAVDTLFVEELEAPPPETTQLEVGESEVPDDEDFKRHVAEHALQKKRTPPPAVKNRVAAEPAAAPAPSYDDAMALEIQKHMHTVLEERAFETPGVAVSPPTPARVEHRAKAPARVAPPAPTAEPHARSAAASPVRKLQEAILTLEWEISRRSVTVLANEIHKMRTRFQDNVIVDFAALSMRVVLEYVVKRMSRAHPESIRFLLEVSDYLDRSLTESEEDPLSSFHHILNRYEKYKSIVRKAEGLPDDDPAILHQLEIKDSATFYKMVDQQAKTIAKAGHSLAKKLNKTKDPENLIRSFRFLVNRAVNRILENTLKEKVKKVIKKRK
ncbi:MAG: hypothetical protein HY912_09695 [Desulfomonile tiedjei]|uniref:Uncharacterized protein n=1 Tax=Desulfomonile tiedjei TaxID=2358 RepID=A0A9D6V632_9BACT|nr:hypothetical protein [Desulfomonile tiedjei]